MIIALLAGKLYGTPVERTSRDGKYTFTTAKLRTAQDGADALFVNLAAFSDTAKAGLLALDDGDACSVTGTLTISVWTDNNGIARPQASVRVERVESVYTIERKRRVARGEGTDVDLAERAARPQSRPQAARSKPTSTTSTSSAPPSTSVPDDTLDDF